jgi:hypothetical protein
VGLRQWFIGLLAHGEAPPADPDELIEVAEVALANGPLIMAALHDEGIDATGVEAIDIRTDTRNRFRILARRSDAARVAAVVDDVITA